MNSYRFILQDYQAINKADIKIDGITVISGINGCGKSTISRWLYAFINTSQRFNSIVIENLIDRCNFSLQRFSKIVRAAADEGGETLSFRRFSGIKFYPEREADESYFYDVISEYKNKICSGCELLKKAIRYNPRMTEWAKKSLGETDHLFSSEDFILDYFQKESEWADLRLDSCLTKITLRKLSDLFAFVHDEAIIHATPPSDIRFQENGINLISNRRFTAPVGLDRAIYIDTPMFLSDRILGNIIWEKLKFDLTNPLKTVPEAAKRISLRIRQIIGGYIAAQETEFTRELELRYVRTEDNLNIPLEETATGLKSFAYLMRLVDNGYLNPNSLLIIDEPEAHLHPQWIVEFARILVLINKELGTKILLASHNPDMVSAISEISKAQNIENTTNFYQAVRFRDTLRYDYEYLGRNVDYIFRSFNIAFDKIKDYGK